MVIVLFKVGHCWLCTKGVAGVSNLLFVTILAKHHIMLLVDSVAGFLVRESPTSVSSMTYYLSTISSSSVKAWRFFKTLFTSSTTSKPRLRPVTSLMTSTPSANIFHDILYMLNYTVAFQHIDTCKESSIFSIFILSHFKSSSYNT